jgi:hypothetical protein
MRYTTTRRQALGLASAAALAMTLLGGTARAADAGEVTLVSGIAERFASGAGWQSLALRAKVEQGDRLRTGADSRLELKLADNSLLRLGAKSELQLQKVSVIGAKSRNVSVRLSIGRLWSAVSKLLGPENNFEVRTDNAVAGVRGTRFEAVRDESGGTTVKVHDGRVLVSNKPAYAVAGATKEKRVQVAGPQEISKAQWEELVASAMQMVSVSAKGEMSAATPFSPASSAADDWEAWNNARDQAAGLIDEKH